MKKQIHVSNSQQGQPHSKTKAGTVMFLCLLVLQGVFIRATILI